MADKRPVAGVVEEVSVNGKTQMRIGGKWYVLSPKANPGVGTPQVGANVAFDAYGRDYDIYYRFDSNMGRAAADPPPAVVPQVVGHTAVASELPREQLLAVGSRRAALQAAATLLAGSDGTMEVVVTNVLQAAQAFEMYLKEQP